MIGDYFDFLKRIAINSPEVVNIRIIREFIGVNSGFIRFALDLRDGCELHVFEYIDSGLHKLDYSYHWLNIEKNLIKRWDNAPHHNEIETFPHHVHDGESIGPSVEPSFADILKKIGEN